MKVESENLVLSNDMPAIKTDIYRHFVYTLGCIDSDHDNLDVFNALAITVRDRLMRKWLSSQLNERQQQSKRVFYLSLEFLLGRSLSNAALNLDIEETLRDALQALGCDYEDAESEELDAGLGNGGLGRLAACFMDSCASLELPVTGYGLRYEYGMFHQSFRQGWQVEQPDHWLRDGNPWEVERPNLSRRVKFYGNSEFYRNDAGKLCARWANTQDVLAVPYDMPIPGYCNEKVNTLRLWKSEATDEFNLEDFNAGDYPDAVAQKTMAEQITMVLYPNDASENGKVLRLRQQYFLASASLQDVMATWCKTNGDDIARFADFHCFQLNDTHPTLAVAELMRLLLDEHHVDWDAAWDITRNTMAYTNHTLLPEALEKWPVHLFGQLLPRILDIIYEINSRFLQELSQHWPGDIERQRRMSIIEEGETPHVRMAYLGIVGSFSVNGVAALHSQLLKAGLFKDFYDLWPHKFNNKTNGVTPRRWLAHCNKSQAQLIKSVIGDAWVRDLSQLSRLKEFAEDASFTEQWAAVKQANKARLADLVMDTCGVQFDPQFLFDVQVKRIHEYKRQLLNILHVIHLYKRIMDGEDVKPRCVLLGGKAAPGYVTAKLIIKFANNVAHVVNNDPKVASKLKVVFFPNYRVSSMEIICPATDLSEQISTAGKEASGTGNMKFMMNGAVTIGTYDGANIEILDAVGEEHFHLFGLRVEEIPEFRMHNNPNDIIAANENLSQVMALIESGHFNMFEPGIFDPIIACIRNPRDPWMVAADFQAYVDAQEAAINAYQDKRQWLKSSILNTAASGHFSSDRTIAEYAKDIWKL